MYSKYIQNIFKQTHKSSLMFLRRCFTFSVEIVWTLTTYATSLIKVWEYSDNTSTDSIVFTERLSSFWHVKKVKFACETLWIYKVLIYYEYIINTFNVTHFFFLHNTLFIILFIFKYMTLIEDIRLWILLSVYSHRNVKYLKRLNLYIRHWRHVEDEE